MRLVVMFVLVLVSESSGGCVLPPLAVCLYPFPLNSMPQGISFFGCANFDSLIHFLLLPGVFGCCCCLVVCTCWRGIGVCRLVVLGAGVCVSSSAIFKVVGGVVWVSKSLDGDGIGDGIGGGRVLERTYCSMRTALLI